MFVTCFIFECLGNVWFINVWFINVSLLLLAACLGKHVSPLLILLIVLQSLLQGKGQVSFWEIFLTLLRNIFRHFWEIFLTIWTNPRIASICTLLIAKRKNSTKILFCCNDDHYCPTSINRKTLLLFVVLDHNINLCIAITYSVVGLVCPRTH